jgi:hypothetical protein
MDGQQSYRKLEMRNKIFVGWPMGIAGICLGLVVPGLVPPRWGVVLGLAMVFLLWMAWIFGRVLADGSAAQAAANRRDAEPGEMRSRPADQPANAAPQVAGDLPASLD